MAANTLPAVFPSSERPLPWTICPVGSVVLTVLVLKDIADVTAGETAAHCAASAVADLAGTGLVITTLLMAVPVGYSFALFDSLDRFYVANERLDLLPRLSYGACCVEGYMTVVEAVLRERLAVAECDIQRVKDCS